MRRTLIKLSPLPLAIPFLTGCASIGEKAASMSLIYGVAAALSLILLVIYCSTVKKRDPWYVLLFVSIAVVNIGYFALAISHSRGFIVVLKRQ